MKHEGEWDLVRTGRLSPIAEAGVGALRLALLFGSGAIALALIATPMLDRGLRSSGFQSAFADGLDMTSTGSVHKRANNRYTLHRSVLQASPSAVCVIREDGPRSGDC